jgi:hypothetical protein
MFAPILRSERLTLTLYEENRDLQTVVDLMNTMGKASPDPTTFVHTEASTRQLLKNTILSPENCTGLRATTHLVSKLVPSYWVINNRIRVELCYSSREWERRIYWRSRYFRAPSSRRTSEYRSRILEHLKNRANSTLTCLGYRFRPLYTIPASRLRGRSRKTLSLLSSGRTRHQRHQGCVSSY